MLEENAPVYAQLADCAETLERKVGTQTQKLAQQEMPGSNKPEAALRQR